MFIILKMYHDTHTHMVIMWLENFNLRKLHVAYRPTLGSYHQHDFFLAKAFAQLEMPQLADNVYTKYLISQ